MDEKLILTFEQGIAWCVCVCVCVRVCVRACACTYPESVSTCLSSVGAFAACQVHKVDPAGDAVLVFLALHKLSLSMSMHRNTG